MGAKKTKNGTVNTADNEAGSTNEQVETKTQPTAEGKDTVNTTGNEADKTNEQVKAQTNGTERGENGNVLVKAGKAAIKKHGLDKVYVTSDGTAFSQLTNAKNHAANLKSKDIITVSK